MRNADYWRGRFSILEDSAHREAQKTIQDMEELYLDAQRSVQKEIESWYARFAVNNQISLTDARKWLTALYIGKHSNIIVFQAFPVIRK